MSADPTAQPWTQILSERAMLRARRAEDVRRFRRRVYGDMGRDADDPSEEFYPSAGGLCMGHGGRDGPPATWTLILRIGPRSRNLALCSDCKRRLLETRRDP